MSRCTGDCCRAFILNATHEELLAWAAGHIRRAMVERRPLNDHEREQVAIARMVVPLDVFSLDEARRKALGPDALKLAQDLAGVQQHYTCKWFDDESGNCTIYEHRPNMCRLYPDNGFAAHGGCAFPNCTASCSRKARQEAEAAAMELERV